MNVFGGLASRGFRIDEEMRGEHVFEEGMGPSGRLPFSFRATWGPDSLFAWLNPMGGRFMQHEVVGEVSAGGLCDRAAFQGTMAIDYLHSRTIRYAFRFEVEGRALEYVGEKVNITPWNLPTSHTTCFGTLKELEGGRLVARSVTHFPMHTALSFLFSLRWT